MKNLQLNEKIYSIKTELKEFTLKELLQLNESYIKNQSLFDRWLSNDSELTDDEEINQIPNAIREMIVVSSDIGEDINLVNSISIYEIFFKAFVAIYRQLKHRQIDYEPIGLTEFEHESITYKLPKNNEMTAKQVCEAIDVEAACIKNAESFDKLSDTEKFKKPLKEVAKGDWEKLSYITAIMFEKTDEAILKLNDSLQTCKLEYLLECFFCIARLRDRLYSDALTSLEKGKVQAVIVEAKQQV